MDEQTVQALLFFAMLAAMGVLSLLESIARRRQQRRKLERMEEAERTEPEGYAPWRVEPWEGEDEEGAPGEPPRREDGPPARIPPGEYDLWSDEAAQRQETPQRREVPRREQAPRRREEAPPRREAPRPAGVPPRAEAPAPREGPSPVPAEGADAAAEASELPPTDLMAQAEELRRESRRELEARPETDGIGEVEVTGPETAAGAPLPDARRRRGGRRSASALRRALKGDRRALEDAVLYREILGRPLGSRRGVGGWEEPEG